LPPFQPTANVRVNSFKLARKPKDAPVNCECELLNMETAVRVFSRRHKRTLLSALLRCWVKMLGLKHCSMLSANTLIDITPDWPAFLLRMRSSNSPTHNHAAHPTSNHCDNSVRVSTHYIAGCCATSPRAILKMRWRTSRRLFLITDSESWAACSITDANAICAPVIRLKNWIAKSWRRKKSRFTRPQK